MDFHREKRGPIAGRWIALIIIIIVLVSIFPISAGTDNLIYENYSSPQQLKAYPARVIPHIDAVKSPGEWDDTQFYTFTWDKDSQNIVEGEFSIKIGFKYNATYLFILAEITEDENPKTLGGLLALFFDSDNNVSHCSPDHVGLLWNESFNYGGIYVHSSGSILGCNCTASDDPSQPVRCTYKNDIYTIEAAVNLSRLNIISSKLDIAYDDGRECASVVNLTQPSNYIPFVFSGIDHASETVLSEPVNLTATLSDSKVRLTWERPLNDGNARITRYKIYRGTSNDSLELIATVNGSATQYLDDNVTAGEKYYYAVSAVNTFAESNLSEIASIDVPQEAWPVPSIGLAGTIGVIAAVIFINSYRKRHDR